MEPEERRSSSPEPEPSAEDVPQASWTIDKLRDFLRRHGGLLKGKKADLLSR